MRSIFLVSSLHDDTIFSFSENESVITHLFIENVFPRATSSSAPSLDVRGIPLLNDDRLINRDARPKRHDLSCLSWRLKVSRVYAAIDALVDIFVVLAQRVTNRVSFHSCADYCSHMKF